MSSNPLHYVTISSATGTVTALMDDTVASMTEGYGGWQEVARARRTSLVNWPGKPVLKMSLPIVFDGFIEDRDMSGDVKALEMMALPAGGVTPPPVVRVSGKVPHTELRWVIGGLQWGDTVRSNKGVLLRQRMVVTFWQYVPGDIITKSPASLSRAKAKKGTTKGGKSSRTFARTAFGYSPDATSNPAPATIYTTQEGDTLNSISARLLGDYKRWSEIADMNGINNPLASLPGGQKIKVPDA